MYELRINIPNGREFFIEQICKSQNLKVGVELGVWKGRTFKHLITSCENLTLFGVDAYVAQPLNSGPETWQPGENGHEWDHQHYYEDMLQFSRNYRNRAFIIKDFSSNAAKFFANESLDFVFIDADHSYEAVLSDIKNWSPKIRKAGFIMGHDIDWPPVQKAVTKSLKQYQVGPDNVWFVQKQ